MIRLTPDATEREVAARREPALIFRCFAFTHVLQP